MQQEKTFKTYRQLLTILRNRGLEIGKGSEGSRVMRILERENYYNIINGYKDLFLVNTGAEQDEQYKPGSSFDEIYAMYVFDRELRHIFLKRLLIVETNFKTVVAHYFSEQYGHDNYLKLSNFDISSNEPNVSRYNRIARNNHLDKVNDSDEINSILIKEKIEDVTRLLGDIQQEIARQLNKNNEMISHYMTVYGYIPLWVLVNVLTFGKITKMYLYMKEADKMSIAREFHVHFMELHKYMDNLSLARNSCAHGERFFDKRYRKHISAQVIPFLRQLGIQQLPNNSGYAMGTNDLFSIVIILKSLLSKSEFKLFINELSNAVIRVEKQLHSITVNDILIKMGFPGNWKDISTL